MNSITSEARASLTSNITTVSAVLSGVSVGLAYVVSQGNITATIVMVRHNNRRNSGTELLQRKGNIKSDFSSFLKRNLRF